MYVTVEPLVSNAVQCTRRSNTFQRSSFPLKQTFSSSSEAILLGVTASSETSGSVSLSVLAAAAARVFPLTPYLRSNFMKLSSAELVCCGGGGAFFFFTSDVMKGASRGEK